MMLIRPVRPDSCQHALCLVGFFWVRVEGDIGNFFKREQVDQIVAAAAVAAHDDVVFNGE